MIKTLAGYIREYKKPSIMTPLFMIAEVVMEMIVPLLMAATVAFIRENAPDGELVDLLFFEQDALNLKILVKSARMGQKEPPFELAEGGTDHVRSALLGDHPETVPLAHALHSGDHAENINGDHHLYISSLNIFVNL